MNKLLTFGLLGFTTSIYALILDRTRAIWKPGLTWLTVVIGVAVCLGFARAATPDAGTVAEHDRNLRTAFIVGGLPVILWRIVRSKRFGLGTQE